MTIDQKLDGIMDALYRGVPKQTREAPVALSLGALVTKLLRSRQDALDHPRPLVKSAPILDCDECGNALEDCICIAACRNCGEEASMVDVRRNDGVCDGCVDPVHGEGERETHD